MIATFQENECCRFELTQWQRNGRGRDVFDRNVKGLTEELAEYKTPGEKMSS